MGSAWLIYVPLHRPETFIHTSLSLFLPIGCFSYCRALLPTCSSMGKVCGNILLTSPSLKLMLSSLSPVRRCWCPKTLVTLSVCPVEVRRTEERKMQRGPGAFLQGLDLGSSFYTPYLPFLTLHIPLPQQVQVSYPGPILTLLSIPSFSWCMCPQYFEAIISFKTVFSTLRLIKKMNYIVTPFLRGE